jgi:hypothetical protein
MPHRLGGSGQAQPLRTLEEIRADIVALERETEGLLGEILGGGDGTL